MLMRNCKIANLILKEVTRTKPSGDFMRKEVTVVKCEGFLCTSEGLCTDKDLKSTHITPLCRDRLTMAITTVLLTVGNSQDISTILLPAIEATGQDWADCFDRRQVSINIICSIYSS